MFKRPNMITSKAYYLARKAITSLKALEDAIEKNQGYSFLVHHDIREYKSDDELEALKVIGVTPEKINRRYQEYLERVAKTKVQGFFNYINPNYKGKSVNRSDEMFNAIKNADMTIEDFMMEPLELQQMLAKEKLALAYNLLKEEDFEISKSNEEVYSAIILEIVKAAKIADVELSVEVHDKVLQ